MGNTLVMFVDNSAIQSGGAITIICETNLTIEDNSILIFNGNNVKGDGPGGAIDGSTSAVTAKENSTVVFSKNKGSSGGAVNIHFSSSFTFSENSFLLFFNNRADGENGGAVDIFHDTVFCLRETQQCYLKITLLHNMVEPFFPTHTQLSLFKETLQ